MHEVIDRVFHLQKAPLIAGLSLDVKTRIASICDSVTIAAGAPVFNQGDAGDGLYIVVSGDISITLNETPINRIGPGSSFGELALLDDGPRTAGALATSDANLLKVPRDAFETLFEVSPSLRKGMLEALAKQLLAINQREVVLRDS